MDVAVIGGGPSGLLAAGEAARRGVDVVVFEEHSRIGVPVHCAGLLSISGLRRLGLPPRGVYVQNRVRGAFFYSPSGLSFTVERPSPVACVVDRELFDQELAERASDMGAELRLNTHVDGVKPLNGQVQVYGSGFEAKASVVVDAEGLRSRIVKQLGLKTLNWSGVLPAAQVELKGVDVDEDFVEVHVGRTVAPGFFAWVIPIGGSVARVGLACRLFSPVKLLRSFVKRRFGVHLSGSCGAGCVLTCGPIPKTQVHRILIVGDAAGQTKPTTGGGVITGGLCGLIAGETAAKSLLNEDYTLLGEYEARWRKLLGPQFTWMKIARKTLNSLPDSLLDEAFRQIIQTGINEELSEIGDMDFQAPAIGRLATGLVLRAPLLALRLIFSWLFA